MTKTKNRKLQMNILGKHEKIWTQLFLRTKINTFGLSLHGVEHYSSDHSELVVSGESRNLWKFIKSLKSPMFFVKLDKIVFTFLD
ncbi:hypothetical protein A2380_02380 [candidate division WWE3 bacterium RIFOXYB1_FULL_43_24]|uniref:Acylphosphatase-like domain-containing protein n=1 Tax=candidate division WWE3 bacterium GW2011_GWF1_42_14 TaxID=1619138 RepID=A0A0G1AS39_UNCKA|nr:MAG: hypothetical protein UU92_C0008G0002 [candidate division WWE3 bacterium GW2011_GWA1_42_12]KKS36901.1 MAG: hypothetical protein UV00_C0019G0002 [candidate division WWE3 bacterium GW2011_GWF1_42_14]OGC60016.1 MAG: hypothetical protein A2212_02080 [candidate division WWE3 bacterium RIFOXYA1_FULL_42_9]OGC68840.1 MAG: hypothetical protein A2380_02380 [candidate division WWE3 bacterium RIFOXYB1_FULL_43_24]OGC72672.1 MAG: hypothetical protein A2414_03120 [candidate division WWE3 bacterium RIFO